VAFGMQQVAQARFEIRFSISERIPATRWISELRY
jgi:hypothetical protein